MCGWRKRASARASSRKRSRPQAKSSAKRAPRGTTSSALAHGELDRQVFLDRHDLGELAVEGAVGDAEAAMADHGVEPVVAERGAGRQGLDIVGIHQGADLRWPHKCAFATKRTSVVPARVGRGCRARPEGGASGRWRRSSPPAREWPQDVAGAA